MCITTNNASIVSSTRTAQKKGSTTTVKVPSILQFWRRLHHVTRPMLPYNVSLTVVTALFLALLRFSITWYLQDAHGWPSDSDVASIGNTANGGDTLHPTKEAAASLVGVFHSMLLVPGLIASFLAHTYNPSERLEKAPVWWQESATALLQFCTGYMVYDGLMNIAALHYPDYSASDWMFLGHHLATALYMSSTRMLGAGHMSAMMCMLLGECTNPFQNLYYVAKFAMSLSCCNGSRMQSFHRVLEVSFCALYVLIRLLVGPAVCLHMTFGLVRGKEIPWTFRIVWILLIWAVLIGSIPWIQDCLSTLQRYQNSLGVSGEL